MRFAICNEIFQGWKLEDVFSFAAKTGYDAVEIAPFTIANSVTDVSAGERQRIRENAAQHRIQIAGIHWVLVKPEGLYINHPDDSIRERTPSILRRVVLVEGAPPAAEGQDAETDRILQILLADLPVKQAAALAAQITGKKKNALYDRALALKQ